MSGRRIANMLRRELDTLIEHDDRNSKGASIGLKWNNSSKNLLQDF